MTPDERNFPTFALEVFSGLYHAALTDADVFLIALTGALLGRRTRAQRAHGVALGLYVVLRRLDRYVDVGVQLAHLAHLSKQAQQQPEADLGNPTITT